MTPTNLICIHKVFEKKPYNFNLLSNKNSINKLYNEQ